MLVGPGELFDFVSLFVLWIKADLLLMIQHSTLVHQAVVSDTNSLSLTSFNFNSFASLVTEVLVDVRQTNRLCQSNTCIHIPVDVQHKGTLSFQLT